MPEPQVSARTIERMRVLLQHSLAPQLRLDIADESAAHAGHAGRGKRWRPLSRLFGQRSVCRARRWPAIALCMMLYKTYGSAKFTRSPCLW